VTVRPLRKVARVDLQRAHAPAPCHLGRIDDEHQRLQLRVGLEALAYAVERSLVMFRHVLETSAEKRSTET